MKYVICFATLVVLPAGFSSLHAQESEFYKKPTNTAEYWRALQFEISVGKFDIAAEHLKGLLAIDPKDQDLVAIENKDGMAPLLRLRNVDRWSRNPGMEKEARANAEKLIQMVSAALKNELGNPVRIAKFAKNLMGSPEESAFAIKELLRSGVDAIPVLIDVLRGDSTAAQRAAILGVLPLFDVNVVPPLVACLDANDVSLKMELLDSLRKRTDYLTFAARVETDLTPYLWYFSAPLAKNPESLRKKARDMLTGLLDRDPSVERAEDRQLPQWRLSQFTRKFLDPDHKPRFGTADQAMVWKWDGSRPVATPMSFSDAEEYYGLRYGRWALEIQPDYREAQESFLTLALQKHFARSGGETPLARSSPALYAVLATAPYGLLADLAETYLRENRVPESIALLQAIGDRREAKAARPGGKPTTPSGGGELRPSLLLKALDYPDRRVKFAAVEAILKAPNPQLHQRASAIVKVLAAYLQADAPPDDAGKPKALIGDPDRVRSEALAGVVRQAGYRAEIARTGRDLIRRLHEKADVDLVLIDQHLVYPTFADTLAQIRADLRTRDLPVAVVASPDHPTTAHPITLLGRLAALAAADEHLNFFKSQELIHDPRSESASTRFKKRLDTLRKLVQSAGIQVSNDVEDRLEYLVYLTTEPDIAVPVEMETTRLSLGSLEREGRMQALQADPRRGRLSATEAPFANARELTPALAVVVARYELALPPQVLELAKPYWRTLQYGQKNKDGRYVQDPLPGADLRQPEVEARVSRTVRGQRGVRVIPEILTDLSFKEEMQGFFTIQDPKQMEAEKKGNAKAAMEWLRKMAVGELSGYPVADAEMTIRRALQDPELASLAIDAVARFPGRDAQQDIASVVLGPFSAEVRAQAVEALIKHIQERGRMISDPQRSLLTDKVLTEADPQVKMRLLDLRGILDPSAKETGARLIEFTPGAGPGMEPKEKKEEPKN